jgi:hypothetical protein
MIRKVYEVDPLLCPKCGGRMKVLAFITEHAVVDRIIDHLKLRFVAGKPPPEAVHQELLFRGRPSGRVFSRSPGRIFSVIISQPEGRGASG